MIVSKKTLEELVPGLASVSPEKTRDAFVAMGIEVASMKQVKPVHKLVVGNILDVKKHPNADTLNVCIVNIGEFGTRKIVCGAPNVRKDLRVVVALEGAVMFNGTIIGNREIRGVDSQGMICAMDELAGPDFVSDYDKENIIELDSSLKPGATNVNELLFLDDTVYELELTANRPDLNGVYALSVELASGLGLSWKRVELNRPSFWKTLFAKNKIKSPRVNSDLAPVFVVFQISDVKVGKSGVHTQAVLRANGIKPVNNIVDITNLAMLYAAGPAHAYDADKIAGRLHVRAAGQGETVATLDNKEYKLNQDDIVITDDNGAVGIAGVIGGSESRVRDTTTNVLFEVALFDQLKVRNTAAKTIITDAVALNSRPRVAYSALVAYDFMVKELTIQYPKAEISPARGLPRIKKNPRVSFTQRQVDRLLGFDMDKKAVRTGLKSLGFETFGFMDRHWTRAPLFRNDVTAPHDVMEEIVKSTGLDNVPFIAPVASTRLPESDTQEVTHRIVSALLASRLNEVRTYNLTDEKNNALYKFNDEQPFTVKNALSAQRQLTRTMILGQLVDVASTNMAHKLEEIFIFETNPMQTMTGVKDHFAGLLTGTMFTNRVKKTGLSSDFYAAKGIVEAIGNAFGLRFTYRSTADLAFGHPAKTAYVLHDGNVIGVLGELRPALLRSDKPVAFFEIDYSGWKLPSVDYVEPSLHPTSRRDVSFLLDSTTKANEVLGAIRQLAHVKNAVLIDSFMQDGKQSFTVSLTLQAESKTMTGTLIDGVVQLVSKIVADAGGTVR